MHETILTFFFQSLPEPTKSFSSTSFALVLDSQHAHNRTSTTAQAQPHYKESGHLRYAKTLQIDLYHQNNQLYVLGQVFPGLSGAGRDPGGGD